MAQLKNRELPSKSPAAVWIVLLLGSLTAFGPLSMDMYLPALPTIAADLKTSASLVQVSLTACLLGLASGQLIFGPMSDIRGRRKPLIATLLVYAAASALCALSPTIYIFIALRYVQGLTGAAGIVIARAAARDMYAGHDLTKFMALLTLVNGAAPILAPISGGAVLQFASWPVIFWLLGAIGLLMFAAVLFFLPETLQVEKRSEGSVLAVLKTFNTLLRDRQFMGIAMTQAFIMTSMFAYIAGSPFVLQNIYRATPQQFSLLFAVNGAGIIVAAQLTGKFSGKVPEGKLLFGGLIMSLLGSVLLLFAVFYELSLTAVSVALFFVVSSVGIVSTTSFSLAMQSQEKNAGSAAAFLGLLPFIGGAVVSPLVGIAGDQSAIPMGWIIALCGVLSICMYGLFIRKGISAERS